MLSGSISGQLEPDTVLPSSTIKVKRSLVAIFFLPALNILIRPTTAEIHTKEPGGQEAGKTNTVLLLNKDQEFKAFGSKALDAYFEDNCEGQDLLFEKFKMNLHCQDENITMQAKALNGKLTK